jgi:hypothetical protein
LATIEVRVKSAFSARLGRFGFNIYDALVVDLLHEVEIGVWKSLFEHLLRLLDAFGDVLTGREDPKTTNKHPKQHTQQMV